MTHERGIVRPVRSKRTPALGPLAIMAATDSDFRSLRQRLDLPDTRALFNSRLCYHARRPASVCLVGPLTGSPYAAMLLETLRAWGVSRIVFYGWCGAIHPSVKAGDIILPRGAIIDEGTSLHYHRSRDALVESDPAMTDALSRAFRENTVAILDGTVWTTDAIFRETPSKIAHYRGRGALAVEMELSALLSVARFYTMPATAVLVVSDELGTLQWKPGFKEPAFKRSRAAVCDLLARAEGEGW
jgi:uridine phosphorylase